VVADGLISQRYRLGELLGTGGTASVFAAVDVRDDSVVALKILHPHLSSDAAAREALFAEARAATEVRHPNIVSVLDTGVHDGDRAWIALELVAGTSLGEFVEARGPLSVPESLTVSRGVLLALEAAHGAGLVHRDIAPGNIMIATAPGEQIVVDDVRLVDFGLADAAGRTALAGETDGAPAGIVGNVNYLSPEQAQGRDIDSRGDIYQVGAVLYFAVTGHVPFEEATVEETMRAHVSAPPPVPSVRRPGVPRALDRLVVKAMLKHPGARFSSAAEMLEAIDLLAPSSDRAEPRTLLLGAPVHGHSYTTRMSAVRPIAARTTAMRAVHPGTTRALAVGLPVAVPATRPVAADEGRRSPLWAIIGGIAVAAGALAWILSAATVAPPPAADAASLESPSPTPSATSAPVVAAPPSKPTTVAVPDVGGGSVVAAGVLLERAGLVLGTISEESSSAAAGTVLRSSPEVASTQNPGTAVNVVVASGFNAVPGVAGLSRDAASAAVQDAGFVALIEFENIQGVAPDTALRSDPGAATPLLLGRSVAIVVATAPAPLATSTPTPTPTPTGTSAPVVGG
jgi:hypothetical protein